MHQSPNLALPYIVAAQAQKHVTHNEAIRALDALVQLAVKDKDLATPPASPLDGDRYIIPASPSGAFAGQTGRIAAYQDGAWTFLSPRDGWRAYVLDEATLYVFAANAWASIAGGGGASVNPTPLVGVNATADAANRLAVASDNSLFNHAVSDHRLKINKANPAATASVVFQDAFSGRAEMGLAGDDAFRIKVSADGTIWRDAVVVDGATGAVSLPNTGGLGAVGDNLLINGAFSLNQRQFAGGTLAAAAFGHDRWKADTGGASYSVAGGIVTLASGALVQVVEPAQFGFTSLANRNVTISVEAPSQALTLACGSQSGTITAGSGRRAVTLTLGAADSGNLVVRVAAAGAGSATFARIKLEVGTADTGWRDRPALAELQLAQRYYQRLGGIAFGSMSLMFFFNAATAETILQFPVPMRQVPVVTIDNVGSFRAANASVAQALSNIVRHTGVNHYADRVTLVCTLASPVGTTGAGVRLEATTADALIHLTAEL